MLHKETLPWRHLGAHPPFIFSVYTTAKMHKGFLSASGVSCFEWSPIHMYVYPPVHLFHLVHPSSIHPPSTRPSIHPCTYPPLFNPSLTILHPSVTEIPEFTMPVTTRINELRQELNLWVGLHSERQQPGKTQDWHPKYLLCSNFHIL